MSLTTTSDTQLTPAEVVFAKGKKLRIRTVQDSIPVDAQSALAFGYDFVVGDEVLAIGQNDQWFVIGVLRSLGSLNLVTAGDINLLAPNGKIEMMSGKGVEVKGSSFSVFVDKIHLAGQTMVQTMTKLFRWVKELTVNRSGQTHEITEGMHLIRAERIDHHAEKEIRIDGSHVLVS